MKIQILGIGCAKCKKLAETMEAAAKELGVSYEIEKVTDIMKMMDFGVMSEVLPTHWTIGWRK